MLVKINLLLIVLFAAFNACDSTASRSPEFKNEATIRQKDSCDDPDANIECSFLNMPGKVTSVAYIPSSDNSAKRMIIRGRLLRANGQQPIEGAVIYFYHTDAKGYYSKSGKERGVQKWHGRHHSWCITGKNGEYELQTILPAPYPDNTMPAHIHTAIKEKGKQPYYINDFVFADDPMVGEKYFSYLRLDGGNGVVHLKDTNGIVVGMRDILIKK